MADRIKLLEWMAREYRIAAKEMLRSVSATQLHLCRPISNQEIRPVRGSIVACPIPESNDGEPDYFFHWLRDSAIVMSAIGELMEEGSLGEEGAAALADFVRFSLSLDALDGRKCIADPAFGAGMAPQVRQYLRSREEMADVHGDRIRMDVRFNPDGSLDVMRWGRPQLDGPALRALVLMHHAKRRSPSSAMRALIDADLDFTLRYAGQKGYDIWEERYCADYYTRSLQQRALAEGAVAAVTQGRPGRARLFSSMAARLERLLDAHWSSECNCYRSAAAAGLTTDRDIDFAVVLAALHGNRHTGRHSVLDPRMQATFATLVDIFAADYAINRQKPDAAPAMGRYRGDRYLSGGAFYFSTLGAAEFYYRLAAAVIDKGAIAVRPENAHFLAQIGLAGQSLRRGNLISALVARGDAFMETVWRFTPPSGALSEQFDQRDGRQTSARDLAWSYAAFISATAARRRVT